MEEKLAAAVRKSAVCTSVLEDWKRQTARQLLQSNQLVVVPYMVLEWQMRLDPHKDLLEKGYIHLPS